MSVKEQMTYETAFTIQRQLASLSYYMLKADGVFGSGTANAITEFKRRNGLRARPKIGPLTLSRLFDPAAKAMPLGSNTTVGVAQQWLGTKEVPGKGNNPKLMAIADNLDIWYPGDDVPWCGLFAAHVNATVYPDEPQDFNRLGAREWLKWGQDAGKRPLLGATVVFWRTSPKAWQGHVAPAVTGVTADGKHIRVIGGNQSDSVSEIWFPTSRVLGYRRANKTQLKAAPIASLGSISKRES